jgi:putative MATE family efflux protein
MAPGMVYLRVALLRSSIEVLTLLLVYFLRGLGETKTPMRISLLGNGLNIIGNYVLIFGPFGAPRLGVLGAAISTTVAECVVLVLLCRVFMSRRITAQYGTRRLVSPRWADMRRIANLGIPLGLQGLLEVGSFTLFTVMIARMGTAQLALSHIVLRLIVFAFLPVQGLAVGVSTLVGRYLGREDTAGAEQSGRHALHIGVLYMGGLGLLFLGAPQLCLRLFTQDPKVLAMGADLLRLAGVVQVFDAMYWVSCGVLKGAGDTRWMMVVGTVYNWLVFLPLAYLFGVIYAGGVLGAWIGFALMILFQGLTFWGRVKRGRWKELSILRPEERLSERV